ncbi:manganese superoxide dismutase [Mycena vulgaris]|nr:manganese superoxide dismutase [Mycena vulgaris]
MSFLWRCRHSLIRARLPLIPRGTRGVTGQFDHLPLPLPYRIEDGLGNFLPPPALEVVAMEYQLGLLARLTDEVRQTDDEDSSVTQVVISTAPFRQKTLAFNYASLALNNSFFLSNLTPDPVDAQEGAISPSLRGVITTDHGGLEQLQSTFSAAAMGMFTSGYVWFVCDRNGSTAVLPTFGPGTLLVRSRSYMAHPNSTLFHQLPTAPAAWDREQQYIAKYLAGWDQGNVLTGDPEADLHRMLSAYETPPPETPADAPETRGAPGTSPAPGGPTRTLGPRFLHTSALRARDDRFGGVPTTIYASEETEQHRPKSKVDALHTGDVLYPLFCVAVQEHAWLSAGYGVWGKEAWLREFWSVLNWRQVSEAYDSIRSTTK